ncbi:MarR family winged helix-turn-helix transcriptional regulator [Streptomyces coeruleorubidus]
MESDRFVTDLGGPGDHRARRPGDGPEVVAAQIADAVESLAALWSVAAQEASLRLSLHQLRALRTLEAAPGLNLTALADQLDIGLPTASRLCDRLAAAGLLERAPHPDTRREVQLWLTTHGRHVLGDVAGRRAQALARTLAAMEPGERVALSRGLRGFLAARDAEIPRADGAHRADGADGADPADGTDPTGGP